MKRKRKHRCTLKDEPGLVTVADWKAVCEKQQDAILGLRKENKRLTIELLAATVKVERVGPGDGPGGQT